MNNAELNRSPSQYLCFQLARVLINLKLNKKKNKTLIPDRGIPICSVGYCNTNRAWSRASDSFCSVLI